MFQNVWKAKVAPASILSESRWPRNQFKDSVIMIGLPQHIAIGFLRFVNADQAVFEFFDPAGPTGDREGVRELRWAQNALLASIKRIHRKWVETDLPRRIGLPVEFHQCHRKVNFQYDIDDVMCQTWIWYWVYFRIIHEVINEITCSYLVPDYLLDVTENNCDPCAHLSRGKQKSQTCSPVQLLALRFIHYWL